MRACSTPDHPRSRGVYNFHDPDYFSRDGSSPLARGLPLTAQRGDLIGRIIPARAGFTIAALRAEADTPDHPRSRGVYAALGPVEARFAGSSPLARGLLRLPHPPIPIHRIIPARAGFTYI